MMKITQSFAQISVLGMTLLLAAIFMLAGNTALGQALPAAEASPISTGFALPTTLGSLQYAISASQSEVWGYYANSGVASSTNISGDIAYLSGGKRHPFSAIFSGGRSFSESGQSSYSFLGLGFSQVANIGRWNIILSDNVSYLPGTAVSGLSGVPGLGDLGVNPVPILGDTGQGLLTNFSNRVSNLAAASVQRQLTGKTSVNASGSYSTTRFIDSVGSSGSSSGAGLDSDAWTAGAGISHEVDARNSFGGNYAYSNYGYSGNSFGISTPGFVSQTASAVYSHQFSRKLSSSIAAGPQWTSINSSGHGAALSLFADVSATYNGKSTSSSIIFTRGTNNGFGSIGGASSDSVVFVASRAFAVVWKASATSSYTHTSNLPGVNVVAFSSDTAVEGIQISRAIARSLSGYASYTLEKQTYTGASTVNVFSGLSQVLGFGLTFSPSALHLGRQ